MPASEWVQGSALALLSAALGYWAGFIQTARDNARRRKAVASALLVELRTTERMLRKLAAHSHAAHSTVHITMEVYDRFEAELVLFEPEVTRVLVEIRGFVRDIDKSRQTARAQPSEVGEEAHRYFRVKAAGAAQLIPEAKELLVGAGGTLPPQRTPAVYRRGETPQLPAPAFPDAVADLQGAPIPPAT